MANSSCRASSTKPVQHLPVDLRVPNDPFLANLFLPSFKLRLDEAKHLPGWLQKGPDRRQDNSQRNEGHIHHRQIQRLPQVLRLDIPDVGSLHGYNRDRTGWTGQLAIAHIDGEDLGRPVLQEAVGEATGWRLRNRCTQSRWDPRRNPEGLLASFSPPRLT